MTWSDGVSWQSTEMNSDVLVVGSANADLVVAADRRPGGGETVLGGDTVLSPGGKGANTAVAAGRLGADVALLGAVGDDTYGRLLLGSLRAAGVDTGLVRTSDRPTGIAYITVTPDGENSILVSPGANSSLEPADVEAVFDGVRVMVASLEVPLPTVEHAVAKAAEQGVKVLLNLSPHGEALHRDAGQAGRPAGQRARSRLADRTRRGLPAAPRPRAARRRRHPRRGRCGRRRSRFHHRSRVAEGRSRRQHRGRGRLQPARSRRPSPTAPTWSPRRSTRCAWRRSA